ncbi:hypothetical protein, partial [Shewanella indica]|uniref:hypothetical protein n=2 Tax=Shewanella indica TaxID=768528 RepID=UPI00399AA06E
AHEAGYMCVATLSERDLPVLASERCPYKLFSTSIMGGTIGVIAGGIFGPAGMVAGGVFGATTGQRFGLAMCSML